MNEYLHSCISSGHAECTLRGGANGISHLDSVNHDLTTSADGLVTVYLHTPGALQSVEPRLHSPPHLLSQHDIPERRVFTSSSGADSNTEILADDVLGAYCVQARSWSEDLTDLPETILDAISNLHGAFALLIHDASAERIIAARDREVRPYKSPAT